MSNSYQIYLISDSTGETLDRIFLALKAQFKNIDYKVHAYSFTRTENQISKILESTYEGVIEINQIKNPKKTFFSKYGNNMFFYFITIYISLIFFLKTNREIK